MKTTEEYKKIRVLKVRGLNAMSRAIRFEFVEANDRKNFCFKPGSFVMISIPGYGESPFSITTSPSELPEIEIAVKSVGNNSLALNRLKPGDSAYLRGPLGNSLDFKEIYGRNLVVIAGGIGIAPLRSIIKNICENPYTVSELTIVYGTKKPEDIVFKEDFAKWTKTANVKLTVDEADESWEGEIGKVTDTVKKLKIPKDASAIICGPPVMYEALGQVLVKKDLDKNHIYFMLERRMKCGIGKCQHCTCGDKYVCTDGPTFTLTELEKNWEALK